MKLFKLLRHEVQNLQLLERTIGLLTILLIVLPWSSTQAATPLAELRYSPDVTVTLGVTLLADQNAGADNLSAGVVTLLDIGPIPTATDLVAYHLLSNGDRQLAFDTTVTLGAVNAEPRDVMRYDGAVYTLDLDGSAVGIPSGVQIDAIARTADGNLLLSFDSTVILGAITADDEDLVRFDGSFSLFLDTSAAGISPGLDLNGAHKLFNGHLLLSFDGSGTVGGIVFNDEDVLEYDPASAIWELAYDGSAQHATWAAAELDALWATEPTSILPGHIQFNKASYSVGEVGPTATITVTRSGGSAGAVSVDYASSDDSATDGNDYTGIAGTLNWADGDSADKTFSIPITDDALVEGNENVNLNLSGATGSAALGTPQSAILSILDNDAPAAAGALQFSTPTYNVGEGGITATITVTRSGIGSGAVSVDYASSNGSATDGNDYTATVGTLNWADSDTAAKTFDVPILEDALVEGDESVKLSLSTPTGEAVVGTPGNAMLSIMDNDGPAAGVLQFSSPTYSVAEYGGSATITVLRSGGSVGAVSVSYASSDGSATAGDDYTATPGTLSWTDGDSAPKTFSVPIQADNLTEGEETVNLSLGSATGGVVLGTTATAVLSIVDKPIKTPIVPIPTLSQWVLLLLVGLLGLIGSLEQRNRLVLRR